MEHRNVTERIIGCAYKVHNRMGFGFLESVYEKCMLIELLKAGCRAQAQVPIEVLYDGHTVGEFFADLLVEDSVIIELKSVRRMAKTHEIQLVNYLTATKMEIGLLINFAEQKVEIKRKTRLLPPNTDF